MRYFTEYPKTYTRYYAKIHSSNHPVYRHATLYTIGDKGLCVIQQHYISKDKSTIWRPIEESLEDLLYLNENFKAYFDKYAAKPVNGEYPTVTLRQIMHGLKMKPLKREPWETAFDHCPI